ncbi:hypothetical protein [Mycetocola spongiae]|uniref:hypothetical protein n=1 Tax=Mycetocola spongiae TaxID=2859226 RepID=UPI001CF269A4|nr:hypothetical protein [Mycetocola spongiae]UCR89245.1 hypothetical protein KXZ72_00585 [Mycetocola spongiae]
MSCDLLEVYGIDTFAEDFPDRSWHSVRARIDGLLSTRSRLAAWLASHDIKEPT